MKRLLEQSTGQQRVFLCFFMSHQNIGAYACVLCKINFSKISQN